MLFDKVYYINLDHRDDRKDHVIQQMQNAEIDMLATRLPAVYGKDLDINNLDNIITPYAKDCVNGKIKRFGITLTQGGVGCAMSHKKAWETIIENDNDNALILEDDVDINDKLVYKLNYYEQYLPPDWDIIFLGYHPTSMGNFYSINNRFFLKTTKVYGLFGYIVSKSGAEKLLKLFPINLQIDSEFENAIKKYKLNVYVVKPNLRLILSDQSEVSEKRYGSDIQALDLLEHFDSTNNNSIYILVICIVIIIIIAICLILQYN